MKICIVGGGSAGWMSASTLSLKDIDSEITLISSKDISPVCVGESTLEKIHNWKEMLPFDEVDFIKETNLFPSSISTPDSL